MRLWQDWRFAATQYLAVKDQQFVVSIDAAITRTDPVRMGDLSPEAQGRSQALCSFLSGLVMGRLLSILRSPSLEASSNGFEAIRLHQEIEPSTGAASIGLLETILAIPEPPKGTPLRDSILAVERLFEDYEVSSTEKLSENLKIATLRETPSSRVEGSRNIVGERRCHLRPSEESGDWVRSCWQKFPSP